MGCRSPAGGERSGSGFSVCDRNREPQRTGALPLRELAVFLLEINGTLDSVFATAAPPSADKREAWDFLRTFGGALIRRDAKDALNECRAVAADGECRDLLKLVGDTRYPKLLSDRSSDGFRCPEQHVENIPEASEFGEVGDPSEEE